MNLKPLPPDNNTLNKPFYNELLHIIGLTETKNGNKKLIQRKAASERDNGSLLENAISQLDSMDKIARLSNPPQWGESYEEQLFNVGLELVLTWVNRILFLKLLEGQLLTYHKNDKAYAFLTLELLPNFSQMNNLFFQVLACRTNDRKKEMHALFAKVPYLNSSLFEPTELEQLTLFISNLTHDRALPLLATTVLKDDMGKRKTGKMNTLAYLFEFLNAYDFGSEGAGEIQAGNKPLINAAVLGLIFEKINGYKDGSFFTPGFMTRYMCRETIQRLVIQKFNERNGWHCQTIEELHNKIEDIDEANEIINSLRICDPAVGSGHFLVSALNEIIALKQKLKLLQDRHGRRLKEYKIETVNDELLIFDDAGEIFKYQPTQGESQRIQETLFYEKQTLIENCLFGVDINPNSVKICRLRLWIELLKYAYYKPNGQLETLPNIDINIRVGNSLVSRFPLKADHDFINNNKIYDNAFEWRVEFPKVLNEAGDFVGFDLVIGNPPYGVKLSQADQLALSEMYDFGTTETAILFIKKGYDLLNRTGHQAFIVPKSYTYASNYARIRQETLSELQSLVDCGKVWQDVKLEVCIFHLAKNQPTQAYTSLKRFDNKIHSLGEINKELCHEFDFFLNGLVDAEINLGRKIKNQGISLNELATNQRGGMFQKYVGHEGELVVIGGAELARYTLKDKPRDWVKKADLTDSKWKVADNAVLVQNIVAHIENPTDHIKIIAAIVDNHTGIAILDTVNQLIPLNDMSNKNLVALLNSKLINWYTYRFVFGKAMRTMHFDSNTTAKLFFPRAPQKTIVGDIESIVTQIFAAKQQDTTALEQEIDRMVYALYGLTDEEMALVETALG